MTLIDVVACIAGMAVVVYLSHFSNRGGGPGEPGRLCYGLPLWILGAACLTFVLWPVAAWWLGDHDEPVSMALLVLMSCAGAVYSFGEAAFVRGTFDEHGIAFSSPWTGAKHEAWKDLVSLRYNAGCSWYALKFRSGKTIRLSRYLDGHRAAVEMAGRCGNSASRPVDAD